MHSRARLMRCHSTPALGRPLESYGTEVNPSDPPISSQSDWDRDPERGRVGGTFQGHPHMKGALAFAFWSCHTLRIDTGIHYDASRLGHPLCLGHGHTGCWWGEIRVHRCRCHRRFELDWFQDFRHTAKTSFIPSPDNCP